MKHKYEYKVGGKVKISDRWYEIVENNNDPEDDITIGIKIGEDINTWIEDLFIQDYAAPELEEHKPVYIFAIVMSENGEALATLSNGFTVFFTAKDLISLESFNK